MARQGCESESYSSELVFRSLKTNGATLTVIRTKRVLGLGIALGLILGGIPVSAAVAAPLASSGQTCTIWGGSGNDTLTGSAGADIICGLGGNDTIRGLGGNDVIDGGTGADWVSGGDGNDLLYGGSGSDGLYGGNGADQLSGGTAGDSLSGGSGIDMVTYAYVTGTTTPVTADLDDIRDDGIAGEYDKIFSDVENLIGSSSNDRLTGNAANNALSGGGGADTLVGSDGNDNLSGGGGTDNLSGGSHTDVLNGGTGQDALAAGDGTDRCIYLSTDTAFEGGTSCEEKVLDVPTLLAELNEPLRPYSDANPDRCLVNNCGMTVEAYCFSNKKTGYVWGCVMWDGWGGGWYEGITNPPGTDSPFGPQAGPLYPGTDWFIFDRSKLPEWAAFVANPGSYIR